jgi:hypothetical protein
MSIKEGVGNEKLSNLRGKVVGPGEGLCFNEKPFGRKEEEGRAFRIGSVRGVLMNHGATQLTRTL